jgi:hypothetical protein
MRDDAQATSRRIDHSAADSEPPGPFQTILQTSADCYIASTVVAARFDPLQPRIAAVFDEETTYGLSAIDFHRSATVLDPLVLI